MNNPDFAKILRSRTLKATPLRLNFLSALHDFGKAMPYPEIQNALSPIDRVTLYRTIESLTSKGVIHKAYQEGNISYYAVCDHHCSSEEHQHNHLHFKCVECESVTCEPSATDLKVKLPGYQIQQISIAVEGVCKACTVT